MCQNAEKTVGTLGKQLEPIIVNFLTIVGVASTPAGQSAIAAYDALVTSLEAWVPGSAGQVVLEAISAFTQVFDTLPVPAEAKALVAVIDAGIAVIEGVITGNSATPAGEEPSAVQHEATINTVTKVKSLVPEFRYRHGIFAEFQSSPAKQVHNAWNNRVDALVTMGFEKYAVLKQ